MIKSSNTLAETVTVTKRRWLPRASKRNRGRPIKRRMEPNASMIEGAPVINHMNTEGTLWSGDLRSDPYHAMANWLPMALPSEHTRERNQRSTTVRPRGDDAGCAMYCIVVAVTLDRKMAMVES